VSPALHSPEQLDLVEAEAEQLDLVEAAAE
jgi:hypothetical protein